MGAPSLGWCGAITLLLLLWLQVRQVPLEAAGWGPQLLARSASEMWAEALAASWQQGQPTSVRALVLLPVTGSVQEAMVR
jgi:hypothetical protein